MTLPTDRDARNALPVWDGCLSYFPDTWAEIAKVSVAGNKQYGFGGKLRWERSVSTDHFNKVIRHMLDHEAGRVIDIDGTFHLAKAAWRILAALQLAIEARQPNQSTSATGTALRSAAPSTWIHGPDCPVGKKLNPVVFCNCGEPPHGINSAVNRQERY